MRVLTDSFAFAFAETACRVNAIASHSKLHVFPSELCAAVHAEIDAKGIALRHAIFDRLMDNDSKSIPSSPPAMTRKRDRESPCASPSASKAVQRISTPFDKLEESMCVKQVKQDQQRTASPDSSAAEETTVLDGVIHEPHEKALAQHLMKRKKSSLPSSASAPSLLCFAADAYPIAC